MDSIFCGDCGMGLDEAPTLLPDQRPPCPQCGSLARRFEQDITDRIALSDGGTATIVHAQTATVRACAEITRLFGVSRDR
jgi:hypothetical protein